MSYISPIKIGYKEEPEEGWTDKIGRYMAGEVDNLVLQSCVKVGCHVDKDELEKALRYDRDQYVKGYEDGKRDAAAAIEELQAQLPKLGEWQKAKPKGVVTYSDGYAECSRCHEAIWLGWGMNFCPHCGTQNKIIDPDDYDGAKMEVQE